MPSGTIWRAVWSQNMKSTGRCSVNFFYRKCTTKTEEGCRMFVAQAGYFCVRVSPNLITLVFWHLPLATVTLPVCATAVVLYRFDIKTVEFTPKFQNGLIHMPVNIPDQFFSTETFPHILYWSTMQQVSNMDVMLLSLQYVMYFYVFSLYLSYTFIRIQRPTQQQTGHCALYKRKTPASF